MAWLRIDDGFAAHPKIAALSDKDLRVWLRVLCYCAKHSDPTVDRVTRQEVPGLTRQVCDRFIGLELLDVEDGSLVIHDWVEYQPRDATGAERQARWRAKRNGSRNGSRNGDVDGADRYESVTSRAGTRACPSRPLTTSLPARTTTDPAPTENGQEPETHFPMPNILKDMPA